MRKFAATFGQQLVQGAHSWAEQQKPQEEKAHWTFGDVWRGSIGAAMGAGVARGASRVLGLSPRMTDKIESIGLAVGAAANTGRIKMAADTLTEDRRRAFKLGAAIAMSGASEAQLRKVAIGIFIDPIKLTGDIFKAPGRIAAGTMELGRAATGSGGIDSHLEKSLSEEAIHEMLLSEKLEKLLAQKRNRALREVLRGSRR